MIKTNELKNQIELFMKQQDQVIADVQLIKNKLDHLEKNSRLESIASFPQMKQSSKSESITPDQLSSSQKTKSFIKQIEIKDLTNQMLIVKELVKELEKKTKEYVAQQKLDQVSQPEVVEFVFIFLQSMTEWASEYITNGLKSQSS
jgi:hypothetical protein